jgi:hypothetical protein
MSSFEHRKTSDFTTQRRSEDIVLAKSSHALLSIGPSPDSRARLCQCYYIFVRYEVGLEFKEGVQKDCLFPGGSPSPQVETKA